MHASPCQTSMQVLSQKAKFLVARTLHSANSSDFSPCYYLFAIYLVLHSYIQLPVYGNYATGI